MKNLGSALKKHYFKRQNKIVFKNNLTLNQLATLIWEKEGFKGIDPSALSRIISGERNFTLEQLHIFTEILNLNENDSLLLKKALQADILSRHGFMTKIPDRDHDKRQKSLVSIENSIAKLSAIESHVDLLYKNIYKGGAEKVKEGLQGVIRLIKKMDLQRNKYGAHLFSQVTLIYIRCLTDLITPDHFQRLIYMAENSLEFSRNNLTASLGVSFRMLSLTKRMQLLAADRPHLVKSIGNECLELSQLALRHTSINDHSENLRNHWEIARVSLVLKKKDLFEKHIENSFNIIPKLLSGKSFLESMTWDLRARGELRFRNDASSALKSITQAQKINANNYKTVDLYLSVTKSQALQKLRRKKIKQNFVSSKYGKTPYEELRFGKPSLIGL